MPTPELIAMREKYWQRWKARPRTPIMQTPPTELDVAQAFAAGFMACWGEYRDVILASVSDAR